MYNDPHKLAAHSMNEALTDVCWIPGSLNHVPHQARVAAIQFTLRVTATQIECDNNETGEFLTLLRYTNWYLKCYSSSEVFFHLPAVARGFAIATLVWSSKLIGLQLPSALVDRLTLWLRQLTSWENHLRPEHVRWLRLLQRILPLECNPSKKFFDVFAKLETVTIHLESWMLPCDELAPVEPDDRIEELMSLWDDNAIQHIPLSFGHLSPTDFVNVLCTIASSGTYVPLQAIQRLSVELTTLPPQCLSSQISSSLRLWGGPPIWVFSGQAHETWTRICSYCCNLARQIQSFSPQAFRAINILVEHLPVSAWSLCCVEGEWSHSTLHWLCNESPYFADDYCGNEFPFPIIRIAFPGTKLGGQNSRETILDALRNRMNEAEQETAELNDFVDSRSALCSAEVFRDVHGYTDTVLDQEPLVHKLCLEMGIAHQTLGAAENVLSIFFQRIQSVRSEIASIRAHLSQCAKTLEHSRWIQKVTAEVLGVLVVPPDVVQVIVSSFDRATTEVGTQFRFALRMLVGLLRLRRQEVGNFDNSRTVSLNLATANAFHETLNIKENLAILACLKCRSLIAERIALLNKPRTNIAVQQEHCLRPLQQLVKFMKVVTPLLRRSCFAESAQTAAPLGFHYNLARALFNDVLESYQDTMRGVYFTNICRYIAQLEQLVEGTVVVSESWVGVFHSPQVRGTFKLPLLTDNRQALPPAIFGCGHRAVILESLLDHPLVPIVVTAKKRTVPYEECFRSIIVLLCDVVTREYLFTYDFFCGDETLYVRIFHPVVQRLVDYVADSILQLRPERERQRNRFDNTDVVGLLLLIRMTKLFHLHMNDVRHLTCLNGFFDSLLSILWSALKFAFNLQLEALRTATADLMVKQLVVCRTPTEMISTVHPVSLRYAELSASVMSLSAEKDTDDNFVVLQTNLSVMRLEFTRLIASITNHFAVSDTTVRTFSSACMLNNVFHVVGVWQNAAIKCNDAQQMEDLLHTTRSQFIEQLLRAVFPEPHPSSPQLIKGIPALVRFLETMVANPRNRKEIVSLVCVEILLLNKRTNAMSNSELVALLTSNFGPDSMEGV